jgi:hypothetical protein
MSDTNLPPPDQRRAVLLLATDALAMLAAAIDEGAGLLEPHRVVPVRQALEVLDQGARELRRRILVRSDPPEAGDGAGRAR